MSKTPTNYLEEDKLVKEILQGSEASLTLFWRSYKDKVFFFIKKRIKEEKDTEEILQDTFLAGLDGLRDFNGNCSLYTYLCSIARHKIVDYYRKKKICQIVFSRLPELENLVSGILSPEEKLVRKELKQTIIKVFERIAPIEAKIIRLKYEKGFSIKEIAQTLCLTVKACESKLFRARLAFIKIFNEEQANFTKITRQAKGNQLFTDS